MSDRRFAAVMYLHVAACVFVATFILLTAPLSFAQAQTTPAPAERKELLGVRQLVWESYFLNDQAKLRELIGNDFITMNPGINTGRIAMNFWREPTHSRNIRGNWCPCPFRGRRFRISVMWRSSIRWCRSRWRVRENGNLSAVAPRKSFRSAMGDG